MWRMHAYTLIQLVAFIVLWVVHSIQQTALVFPFVIALEAVMRRFLLTRIFSQSELEAVRRQKNGENSPNLESVRFRSTPQMPTAKAR